MSTQSNSASTNGGREEIARALKHRLDQIPEWPEATLRANPNLDRLQMCQSVDSSLLFRAVRAIRGTKAEPHYRWLVSRLERYPNHTVLEISGFQLQGLIAALGEVSDG